MSIGYEVGSRVTVRALHQMPVEGPRGSCTLTTTGSTW